MVLLFRMSRHQVVLINLHRSLHGKSRILCEIMVYTVFSVLVPFTNTLSINEFQVSSKSVSEKAFLLQGTFLFCGISRSAEPHGIRSRFPPHGRRRSERRDVPDILLPTRLRQFIPDCGQCFGSTPPRPANRPASRGTLPADRRPRKTEEISAWKSPRFHNRILRLY